MTPQPPEEDTKFLEKLINNLEKVSEKYDITLSKESRTFLRNSLKDILKNTTTDHSKKNGNNIPPADPRDIELESAGFGEFSVVRLQEKPFVLYIRDKGKPPTLKITVSKNGNIDIKPLVSK